MAWGHTVGPQQPGTQKGPCRQQGARDLSIWPWRRAVLDLSEGLGGARLVALLSARAPLHSRSQVASHEGLLPNREVRWDICADLEGQADFPSKRPLTFTAYQAGAVVSQAATARPSWSSASIRGVSHTRGRTGRRVSAGPAKCPSVGGPPTPRPRHVAG